ncbi:MAG: hypothetical protein P4L54_09555 [Acidocella sp.]|nr:hypothetical protein [Acidocella sp.]
MTKPRLMAAGLLGLFLLNACAAPPAPVAAAPAIANVTASADSGVVAAVRVSSSASPGVDTVLTALHEPLPGAAVQRDEVVILDHDGSALSTVPDGPAPSLQPGDHVSVIAGDTTNLARQN